jgi:hypothetical protein
MPVVDLRAPSGPTVSVLLYDGMSAFEVGIVTEGMRKAGGAGTN